MGGRLTIGRAIEKGEHLCQRVPVARVEIALEEIFAAQIVAKGQPIERGSYGHSPIEFGQLYRLGGERGDEEEILRSRCQGDAQTSLGFFRAVGKHAVYLRLLFGGEAVADESVDSDFVGCVVFGYEQGADIFQLRGCEGFPASGAFHKNIL